MRPASRPIRTTIIGGLIFLIPFGILLAVFGKVHQIMKQAAIPLSTWLPVEHIGGVATANLITIALILVLCYLAGLLASHERARALYRSVDEKLLNIFPRYGFVKAMAMGLDVSEVRAGLRPVLVQFDDLAQIAFEVERDGERVVVYLPGSPDPWSGSTAIVTPGRVHELTAEFPHVVKSVRLAGRGTLAVTGTTHGRSNDGAEY